jgi:hypothetical protein
LGKFYEFNWLGNTQLSLKVDLYAASRVLGGTLLMGTTIAAVAGWFADNRLVQEISRYILFPSAAYVAGMEIAAHRFKGKGDADLEKRIDT